MLLHPLRKRPGAHTPFGVGIAPPRADPGTRRVNEHQVRAALQIAEQIFLRAGRSDLHIVNARALEALVNRGKSPLIRIGCVDLPPIFHDGREGERLAAGAGADVDDLLAGFGPAEQRCKLRAFVLHLDQAFDEARLGMDGRALGVSIKRKAQTDRRPAREHGIEVREGSAGPLPFRLERVDPQIERRAARQRRGFGYALSAEDAGEIGIEPLRVIARDPRRRTAEIGRAQPRALLRA